MPKNFIITGSMKSKTINSKVPCFSALTYFFIYLLSDHPNNIFDPSRGGIGSKLNKPNNILKNIMFRKKVANIPLITLKGIIRDILSSTDEMKARVKFAKIPADDTSIKSLFLFFNLL